MSAHSQVFWTCFAFPHTLISTIIKLRWINKNASTQQHLGHKAPVFKSFHWGHILTERVLSEMGKKKVASTLQSNADKTKKSKKQSSSGTTPSMSDLDALLEARKEIKRLHEANNAPKVGISYIENGQKVEHKLFSLPFEATGQLSKKKPKLDVDVPKVTVSQLCTVLNRLVKDGKLESEKHSFVTEQLCKLMNLSLPNENEKKNNSNYSKIGKQKVKQIEDAVNVLMANTSKAGKKSAIATSDKQNEQESESSSDEEEEEEDAADDEEEENGDEEEDVGVEECGNDKVWKELVEYNKTGKLSMEQFCWVVNRFARIRQLPDEARQAVGNFLLDVVAFPPGQEEKETTGNIKKSVAKRVTYALKMIWRKMSTEQSVQQEPQIQIPPPLMADDDDDELQKLVRTTGITEDMTA